MHAPGYHDTAWLRWVRRRCRRRSRAPTPVSLGSQESGLDVLDGILHLDRHDTPAITQQRELAHQDRPAPEPYRRHDIPSWFTSERNQLVDQWHTANDAVLAANASRRRLQDRVDDARRDIVTADQVCAPNDTARHQTNQALADAKRQRTQAERSLADSGLLHRRAARTAFEAADDRVHQLETHITGLTAAAPIRDTNRDALARVHRRAQSDLDHHDRYDSGRDHAHLRGHAMNLIEALDTWRNWADGKAVTHDNLNHTTDTLTGTKYAALAEFIDHWAERNHIELRPPTPQRVVERDFSIDIDL